MPMLQFNIYITLKIKIIINHLVFVKNINKINHVL